MKVCKSCDRELSPKNKSGFCKRHFSAFIANDPEWKRKRAEGLRRKFNDPAHLAKMRKVMARNAQKYYADPEAHAMAVEKGKRLYKKFLNRPDIREKNKRAVRAAGAKISEAKIGWCPPEYRDHYRRLCRSKRMLAADAREATLKLVERDKHERRAASHPYFPSVIDFMRRTVAVSDRGPDKDKRYRVGLADMTAGELLKRAEFNGYQYPCYPQARSPSVSLDGESADGKIAA